MQKILYVIFMIVTVSLGVVVSAQAQTTPKKEKPAKEAPKTAPVETEKKPVDLDRYFKNGEENAKTSSCNKPAKPTAPIA